MMRSIVSIERCSDQLLELNSVDADGTATKADQAHVKTSWAPGSSAGSMRGLMSTTSLEGGEN